MHFFDVVEIHAFFSLRGHWTKRCSSAKPIVQKCLFQDVVRYSSVGSNSRCRRSKSRTPRRGLIFRTLFARFVDNQRNSTNTNNNRNNMNNSNNDDNSDNNDMMLVCNIMSLGFPCGCRLSDGGRRARVLGHPLNDNIAGDLAALHKVLKSILSLQVQFSSPACLLISVRRVRLVPPHHRRSRSTRAQPVQQQHPYIHIYMHAYQHLCARHHQHHRQHHHINNITNHNNIIISCSIIIVIIISNISFIASASVACVRACLLACLLACT